VFLNQGFSSFNEKVYPNFTSNPLPVFLSYSIAPAFHFYQENFKRHCCSLNATNAFYSKMKPLSFYHSEWRCGQSLRSFIVATLLCNDMRIRKQVFYITALLRNDMRKTMLLLYVAVSVLREATSIFFCSITTPHVVASVLCEAISIFADTISTTSSTIFSRL